ncbi:hypothetical protein Tco_0371867 [Tanacetum coccineum]
MESILEDEDAIDEGVADKLKKRKQDDANKDEGPSSTETSKGTSKGTSKSHPKSINKSAQAEEKVFEAGDTQEPQNQGQDMGNTDDQPNVKAVSKHDRFKKPERPPNPDSDWNVRKLVDFRPPQTWISKIAQAEKPSLSFDELMSTPIEFSAYVMNNLKINNLTQEHIIGPTFNLFKGTCRSRVKLEYNFEECYKVVTDRLDWNNAEGKEYPFDLSKPLPLIMNQGIEDMVPSLWNLVKVAYDRYAVCGISHLGPKRQRFYGFTSKVKVMKWYDYGYLEEIEVRREVQQLYKFKEGDFPRLHLHDNKDMLLLLVQKKLSNLERDVIFDLGVALQMFTRRIVILKRVKDLQTGVKSYQKKLNITKPQTFRSDISNRTPYTAYSNPQGIIYVYKYNKNRLMRSEKLYKFSDAILTSIRTILHVIASNLRMDYLPKRRWSNLDRHRSRIMIKAIDKLLLERRLMRSLKKFVGGRDYGEDFRLLERTI